MTSDILKDGYFKEKLSGLLPSPFIQIGKLLADLTLDELVEKYNQITNFNTLDKIGKTFRVIGTEDLGIGMVRSFSNIKLKQMIAMGQVPKDLPIYVRYHYGNLGFYLNLSDIDEKLTWSSKVSCVFSVTDGQLYDMFVGDFVYPNQLFHLRRYHGLTTTLEKVLNNETVTCIQLFHKDREFGDIPY